jgi:integrase/recombinase XerD
MENSASTLKIPLRIKEKELSQKAIKRAKRLARVLNKESADPLYLRKVVYYLGKELSVSTPKEPSKLPQVPTEEEIKKYYEAV